MKKVLLLMVAVLMVSSVAMADHIGVYTDASGASCVLAPGFNNGTSTVLHKFSAGATACRFKATLPPGSSLFGFTPTTPFVPVGVMTSDLSIGYGACYTGTIVVGTFAAILGAGTITVEPADGFPTILAVDCNFVEFNITGGVAYVGGSETNCQEPNATEPTTWGQVKALYR